MKAAVVLNGAHALGNIRSTMPHDVASGTGFGGAGAVICDAQLLSYFLVRFLIRSPCRVQICRSLHSGDCIVNMASRL